LRTDKATVLGDANEDHVVPELQLIECPSPHEQNVISIRGGAAVGQNEKRTGPALRHRPNGHS